ncbi:MAG: Nif3-like dinuclear metal center hexameric protein [Clostridia bacterium]|nr:Nif3-like dinuclear metal center hexameric protein [Clostridia bacterium]
MQLKTIYEILDELAPFVLSQKYCEEFDHRDNSGVMLDCGGEIEKILFSLDLSEQAIEEAKKQGANCIVTHHPAIWSGMMRITEEENREIFACVREKISVISAHLNFDAAVDGIDEWMMRGLGGEEALAYLEAVEGGAYGRVFNVKERAMDVFTERTKRTFGTRRAVAYGNAPVKRVACFCGSGFDEEAIAFARNSGADTIVSSDGKHHLIKEAVEAGLNVLLLTHYAAENYGFMRVAEAVSKKVEIPVVTFTDERFL